MSGVDDQSLGPYVRRLRKIRGLTQEELAREVGITKAYICIIERGDLTGRDVSVSPSKLYAIAKALSIPAEEIFNRAGILPAGTVLVSSDEGEDEARSGFASASGRVPSECVRDWNDLCAAGYYDLPSAVREEIKRYIEFRAHQVREHAGR